MTEPAEAEAPVAGSGLTLRLAAARRARRDHHRQRHRQPLEALAGMRVTDGESTWVDFAGNDYLGLAREPSVGARLATAAGQRGAGAGASALVSGYHPEHQALERELAEFLQRDAVLLCGSGWAANLAAITSLAGRGDAVVQDRLCHASLVDAARLSGARLLRYPHGDPSGLRRQLERAGSGAGHRLLVSDGVFSMDGDLAPLPDLVDLSRRYDATLLVDDAHGIGVLGAGGRGCTAGLDQTRVPVLVGTLGKAFGCLGAFVAGSREMVEHLVNHGRSYVYSTALPPALAAAARAALAHVRRDRWRRMRLREHIERFRAGAARRGIGLSPSVSAIQPLLVGEEQRALTLAALLGEKGYRLVAIRPPTVPVGTSRLRVTLSAGHTAEQVDGLLEALAEAVDEVFAG